MPLRGAVFNDFKGGPQMSTGSLYRKYRPRKFADVIGQDAVKEALLNQIKAGRTGHSYLFTGIRGTGKTTLARILAKAVNCLNPVNGEPCGECEICRGIDSGAILDITEIDAASNRGIDNIRDLRDETAYAPAMCRKRVYIIDEIHMLTNESFNALLKILEEPPEHVMFIFATTELNKVPATILSRCQRFELKRLPAPLIEKHLMNVASLEGVNVEPGAAALVARLADGSVRDALSLLDTCITSDSNVTEKLVASLAGVADRRYLHEMCELIAAGDRGALLAKADSLYQDSIDPPALCTELLRYVRDLMLAKYDGPGLIRDCSPEEIAVVTRQSGMFDIPEILRMMNILSETVDKIPTAPDSTLYLQLCLIKLCDKKETVPVYSGDVSPRANQQSGVPKAPAVHKAAEERKSAAAAAEAKQETPAAEAEEVPEETAFVPEIPADAISEDIVPDNPVQTKSAAIIIPEMPADGSEIPFPEWEKVAEYLRPDNGMLSGFLSKTHAWLSGDAVLIESDDFFKNLMNADGGKNRNQLKEAIAALTGKRFRLGAYTPQNLAAAGKNDENARQIEELERLAAMVDSINSQQPKE